MNLWAAKVGFSFKFVWVFGKTNVWKYRALHVKRPDVTSGPRRASKETTDADEKRKKLIQAGITAECEMSYR